jgi:hypothetical protein
MPGAPNLCLGKRIVHNDKHTMISIKLLESNLSECLGLVADHDSIAKSMSLAATPAQFTAHYISGMSSHARR